jgi:16S rRNA (cytosine967-C5)-methyltransferase
MYHAGFEGARGLVVGHILAIGADVPEVFTGERFAPEPLNEVELNGLHAERGVSSDATLLDIPDWLEPKLRISLGDDFETSLVALQARGPLDLRVNAQKSTLKQVQAALAQDDIETSTVDDIPDALRVNSNPRRVALSKAYQSGQVEIQDAGSQAVVRAVPMEGVSLVLDYCAGGGGKTLGLAARADAKVRFHAYDKNKARMNDLPERAKRAGISVRVLDVDPTKVKKQYDLVLLDVPCSGTGAWRRNPDGKWRFSEADLHDLQLIQADILTKTQALVAKDGTLAYVTCSLLHEENEAQVEKFLMAHTQWQVKHMKRFHPSDGTDGFFLAFLRKKQL